MIYNKPLQNKHTEGVIVVNNAYNHTHCRKTPEKIVSIFINKTTFNIFHPLPNYQLLWSNCLVFFTYFQFLSLFGDPGVNLSYNAATVSFSHIGLKSKHLNLQSFTFHGYINLMLTHHLSVKFMLKDVTIFDNT